MDTNIVMALISAGAALLGAVIGASATIMATVLNKKMQEKGKVTLYMRHVASNSGKNWGYYQGSKGMYFRVPLWVDVINECGIPRIIRDINLYAYKEGKEVKEFTQIQRIGDGENAVYDLSNCPIPDCSDCPETARSCVHSNSLISPDCSGDIILSNQFVKLFQCICNRCCVFISK